jgi:hypothetical protein
LRFIGLAAVLICAGVAAMAQDTAVVQRPVTLKGSVTRLEGERGVPKAGAWVVLHRFGPADGDSAAPLDSVRTGAGGEFSVTVRPYGPANSLYFLSSMHAGIAYFTNFWTADALDSADANLVVFDTTRSAVPYTALARTIVLWAPVLGADRRVVERHRIANDSTVTRVATDSSPSWTVRIPEGARDFTAGIENANPHSLRLVGSEVRMFGAFAPGVQDIVYSYALPQSAFPLVYEVEAGAEVLEIVLDEAEASIAAPWLTDDGAVTLEGKTFGHLYHARDVERGARFTLTAPATSGLSVQTYLLLVILLVGAGMLIALAVAFNRRSPAPSLAVSSANTSADSADELARRIARLDDAHAARREKDEKSERQYREERGRLTRELERLLARGGGRS